MGIVKGKTTKAFRTCANKGFHLKFENGWTVSVQFGGGNYCENYDLFRVLSDDKPDLESATCEMLAWKGDKQYPKDDVKGHVGIKEALKFINKVSRFKEA